MLTDIQPPTLGEQFALFAASLSLGTALLSALTTIGGV